MNLKDKRSLMETLRFIPIQDDFLLDFPDDKIANPLIEAFRQDKIRALYELAWSDLKKPSSFLVFMKELSVFFHHCLANTGDLEFLREKVEVIPDKEKIDAFLARMPFFSWI